LIGLYLHPPSPDGIHRLVAPSSLVSDVTLPHGVQPAYRPHVRRPSLFSNRRLFAAPLVIALMSAVLLGGAQEASCAMHGRGAARTSAAPVAAAGHAMPAHATAHHVAAETSPPSGGHRHGHSHSGCDCSCIGACTMSAPLASPPAVVTLHIALVEPQPRRPLDTEPTQSPPREPDRLLPFANGPPAATLA
jgi:hypothetical protein